MLVFPNYTKNYASTIDGGGGGGGVKNQNKETSAL